MDREAGTRIRVLLRAEPEPTPEREEIPRIVRLLALAHRWHRQLDEGVYESQAEIAVAVGLTRARVTQIISLQYLAPHLQHQIAIRSLHEPPVWRLTNLSPRASNWSRQ